LKYHKVRINSCFVKYWDERTAGKTLYHFYLNNFPHILVKIIVAFQKSLGAKETKELAVMIDTFHPLWLTEEALRIENKSYITSWAE
jgi:homogentisate 1,2-dioxygenase